MAPTVTPSRRPRRQFRVTSPSRRGRSCLELATPVPGVIKISGRAAGGAMTVLLQAQEFFVLRHSVTASQAGEPGQEERELLQW